MPASKRMRVSLEVGVAALAIAAIAALAACARNSLGAGYGYQSPPPASFLISGPPSIVATSGLDEDSSRAPIALRAAAVLRNLQWPVIIADSASDLLLSDWQYFEPTVPSRPASSLCESGIGLRLTVRPAVNAGRVSLRAEIAYSPHANQQRALSYGRLIFRELYDAIKAAPEPNGALPEESRGWVELTEALSQGDFHVCGSVAS